MDFLRVGDLVEVKLSEWNVGVVESMSENTVSVCFESTPKEFKRVPNKIAYFRTNTELDQGCFEVMKNFNFLNLDRIYGEIQKFLSLNLNDFEAYEIYQFLRGKLYFFIKQSLKFSNFTQRPNFITEFMLIFESSLKLIIKIIEIDKIKFAEGRFDEKMNALEAFMTSWPEILEILEILFGETEESLFFFTTFVNNPQFNQREGIVNVQRRFIDQFFEAFNELIFQKILPRVCLRFLFKMHFIFNAHSYDRFEKHLDLMTSLIKKQLENVQESDYKFYTDSEFETLMEKMKKFINPIQYDSFCFESHYNALKHVKRFKIKLNIVSRLNTLLEKIENQAIASRLITEKYHLFILQHFDFIQNSFNFLRLIFKYDKNPEIIVNEIVNTQSNDLVLSSFLTFFKTILRTIDPESLDYLIELIISKVTVQNTEKLVELCQELLIISKGSYKLLMTSLNKNTNFDDDQMISCFYRFIQPSEFADLKLLILDEMIQNIDDQTWGKIIVLIVKNLTKAEMSNDIESLVKKIINNSKGNILRSMELIECIITNQIGSVSISNALVNEIFEAILDNEPSLAIFLKLLRNNLLQNIESQLGHILNYRFSDKVLSSDNLVLIFLEIFKRTNFQRIDDHQRRLYREVLDEDTLIYAVCHGNYGSDTMDYLRDFFININTEFLFDCDWTKSVKCNFMRKVLNYEINTNILNIICKIFRKIENNENLASILNEINQDDSKKIFKAWGENENEKYFFALAFILKRRRLSGIENSEIWNNTAYFCQKNEYKFLYCLYCIENQEKAIKHLMEIINQVFEKKTVFKLPRTYQMLLIFFKNFGVDSYSFPQWFSETVFRKIVDAGKEDLDNDFKIHEIIEKIGFSLIKVNNCLDHLLIALLKNEYNPEIVDIFKLIETIIKKSNEIDLENETLPKNIIFCTNFNKEIKKNILLILEKIDDNKLESIQYCTEIALFNFSDISPDHPSEELQKLLWLLIKIGKRSNQPSTNFIANLYEFNPINVKNSLRFSATSTRKMTYRYISKLPNLIGQVWSDYNKFLSYFINNPIKLKTYPSRVSYLPKGLKNFGATCYINAIFQVLNTIPPIKCLIMQSNGSQTIDSLHYILYKMSYTVLNSVCSSDFINNFLDYDGMPISKYEQRDAEEFLNNLICKIEDEGLKGFSQSITGEIKATIQCLVCKTKSDSFQQFISLPLRVKDCANILESLEIFHKPESLELENQYFCDYCQEKTNATKASEISKFPEFFMITLKRFNYDVALGKIVKIFEKCSFPEHLEISCNGFELTGIVLHIGTGEGGHYTNLTKIDGQWYSFNDQTVKRIEENIIDVENVHKYFDLKPEDYQRITPYILLYRKITNSTRIEEADISKFRSKVEEKNRLVMDCKFYLSEDFTYFFNKITPQFPIESLSIFFFSLVYTEGKNEIIQKFHAHLMNRIQTDLNFTQVLLTYLKNIYVQIIYVLTGKIETQFKDMVTELIIKAFESEGMILISDFINKLRCIFEYSHTFFDFTYIIYIFSKLLPLTNTTYYHELILQYIIYENIQDNNSIKLSTNLFASGSTNFNTFFEYLADSKLILNSLCQYFQDNCFSALVQRVKNDDEINSFSNCIRHFAKDQSYLSHYLYHLCLIANNSASFSIVFFKTNNDLATLYDECHHDYIMKILESWQNPVMIDQIVDLIRKNNGKNIYQLLAKIKHFLTQRLQYYESNKIIFEKSIFEFQKIIEKIEKLGWKI